MTAIRNSPQPPVIRNLAPQASSAAAAGEPPTAGAPAPRPSSAYAAAKQKLVSITGRHRAASTPLPGEAMDLKSLLASLRDGGGQVGAPKAKGVANPNDVQRANEAIQALPPPAADHPRMQHLKDVQAQLKKEGLPTDADGVRVYIVGDQTDPKVDHGGMVARTIAGPIGLAQKAEVELSERMPDAATSRLDEGARADHTTANLAVKMGDGSAEQLRMWAVDALEAAYTQPKQELDYLVAHAPNDGQTKIVNMSWGNSEEALVALATKAALGADASPLVDEANAARARKGLPALDLKKPEGQEGLRAFIANQIHQAVSTGDGAQRIRTARAEATASVAKARDAGFLPIAAAGNFHETQTQETSRTNENLVATIPGVLSVGSVDLGGAKMGDTSSPGAAVSAPGVGVPVALDKKTGKTKDVGGTSFAAPYAASVAALMVKANPNITPAEIEKILTSPEVTTDVKNTTRDGAGVMNPVAAVRAAKALIGSADVSASFHTSQDLELGARRAGLDALKKLLPATTPAYKEAIKVLQDDHVVELPPRTQKAVFAGMGNHPDATLGKDVIALAKSKEFLDLGPAAQARFGANFTGLEKAERAEAMKLLKRADVAKLPLPLKDAVMAAASKFPSDTATTDALVKRANDPAFKKLPADAQAAFFRAFEHQHDTIEIDPASQNKASLLKLVDHPEFKKLDAAAQSRWMRALGSDDPDVRKRSFERLDGTKLTKADLGVRADALDGTDTVRSDRPKLPGASENTPVLAGPVEERRGSVFMKTVKPGGIETKKSDVLVHTVSLDGQTFEIVYPKPMPKDVPSPELIAQGIAGLPKTEREHLKQIVVQPEYKNIMQATTARGDDRVYMGNAAPDTQLDMTAMLSHETGHLLASHKFEKEPKFQKKWEAAIAADDHRVSDYATTWLQEDVAETIALYYQVKGTPDEAVMKRDFPNRFALMKELLGE